MLSSHQKAIRRVALSQAAHGPASSAEPGMHVRPSDGNREISGPPFACRARGRVVKADGYPQKGEFPSGDVKRALEESGDFRIQVKMHVVHQSPDGDRALQR
jgi:hypothetical protein